MVLSVSFYCIKYSTASSSFPCLSNSLTQFICTIGTIISYICFWIILYLMLLDFFDFRIICNKMLSLMKIKDLLKYSDLIFSETYPIYVPCIIFISLICHSVTYNLPPKTSTKLPSSVPVGNCNYNWTELALFSIPPASSDLA